MAGALVVSALVAEVAHLKMAAGADPVALRSQNLPRSKRGADSSLPREKQALLSQDAGDTVSGSRYWHKRAVLKLTDPNLATHASAHKVVPAA